MIRPQFRAFICGSAAWMAWKLDERLIAMTASQRSAGNVSIGAVCWMPALLTRMSTRAERRRSRPRTSSWICGGLEMSAPLRADLDPELVGEAAPDRLDRARVAEAVQHDVRALGGERARDPEPDAAGGAGDEC